MYGDYDLRDWRSTFLLHKHGDGFTTCITAQGDELYMTNFINEITLYLTRHDRECKRQ